MVKMIDFMCILPLFKKNTVSYYAGMGGGYLIPWNFCPCTYYSFINSLNVY